MSVHTKNTAMWVLRPGQPDAVIVKYVHLSESWVEIDLVNEITSEANHCPR